MTTKRPQAFTLLELIIVIIIVGVLASLALPRFFSVIESSRGAEALANLSAIRQAVERCYAMTVGAGKTRALGTLLGNFNYCQTWDALAIEDPSLSPNAHFQYRFWGGGETFVEIRALRNTRDGGNPADGVDFRVDAGDPALNPDGAFWIVGWGKFKNIYTTVNIFPASLPP